MSEKGIFSRFFNRRGVTIAPISSIRPPRFDQVDFGVSVTTDNALKFTAVYAAIKLISENVAALPKAVKKEGKGGALVDAVGHKVHNLLRVAPNGYTDVFTFWFTMISNLEAKGNAFAVIERDDAGFPVALHQLRNEWVSVTMSEGRKFFTVKVDNPDFAFLEGIRPDFDMIHLMLFSRDGIIGIDPVTYNAATIGRGLATQKFSADFYRKGGNIRAVLETERSLGDEEWGHLQSRADSFSNGDTPVLEAGLKYKPIGIDPAAAKLIESETMSIQDIARIFSVPPHLLAEMTHSTFSNIEQQNTHFAIFTLRPLCKRIEQQLEAKLLTSREMGRYSIKFDLNGLMRGDSNARSIYYQNGINNGWLTPNEVRALEGFAALPGLDTTRLPLNTAFVDADGKIILPAEAGTNQNTSDDEVSV